MTHQITGGGGGEVSIQKNCISISNIIKIEENIPSFELLRTVRTVLLQVSISIINSVPDAVQSLVLNSITLTYHADVVLLLPSFAIILASSIFGNFQLVFFKVSLEYFSYFQNKNIIFVLNELRLVFTTKCVVVSRTQLLSLATNAKLCNN